MCNPGFSTAASVPVLGVSKIVCVPFKSGVSVSYCPLALLDKSPVVSKATYYGGSSFLQILWAVEFNVGHRPFVLQEGLCGCDTPPTCGLLCFVCGS